MGEGFDVAGGDGADDHFLVPDEFGSVVVVILMGPALVWQGLVVVPLWGKAGQKELEQISLSWLCC